MIGAELPQASCIMIATHGSCKTELRAGGFGAVLIRYLDAVQQNDLERKGGAVDTTSNRMELQAAISALKRIRRDEKLPIYLRSKSKYLVDGWNLWLKGWIRNGWLKGDGKPVENSDLWLELIRLCEGLDVRFQWMSANSGDAMIEVCRELASKACDHWARKAVNAKFAQAV